mgnify:CR=1 FL=1
MSGLFLLLRIRITLFTPLATLNLIHEVFLHLPFYVKITETETKVLYTDCRLKVAKEDESFSYIVDDESKFAGKTNQTINTKED